MDNQLPGYSSVNFDTDNDFSLLIEHLIGQGCQKFLGLSGDPDEAFTTRQRLFAFEKIAQLYEHEIHCQGHLSFKLNDEAHNKAILKQAADSKPDAIICMSNSALDQALEGLADPSPILPADVKLVFDR